VENAGFLQRGDIAEKDMLALKPIHADKREEAFYRWYHRHDLDSTKYARLPPT
jgi:hypothetical protein